MLIQGQFSWFCYFKNSSKSNSMCWRISVLHCSRPKRQILCWRVLQDLNLYHLPAYLPLVNTNSSMHIISSLIVQYRWISVGSSLQRLMPQLLSWPDKTLCILFGEVNITHLGDERKKYLWFECTNLMFFVHATKCLNVGIYCRATQPLAQNVWRPTVLPPLERLPD